MHTATQVVTHFGHSLTQYVCMSVFIYKQDENVMKLDQVLPDGWRIILVTTNDHLKILGDGHF